MATVLLTRGPGSRTVKVHRFGLGTRLLANARALSLDQRLVRGADPDSSPILSLRVHRMIGRTYRVRLARELRQLARDARRPSHPFDSTLRLSRELLHEQDLVEQIAELLDGPEAVDARGMAKLELLLRDGSGPLFEYGAGSLRESLECVMDAITLQATLV